MVLYASKYPVAVCQSSGLVSACCRVAEIDELLAQERLDVKNIRKFCFEHGVPEGAGRRATVWKILLDYLPRDVSEWPKCLAKTRYVIGCVAVSDTQAHCCWSLSVPLSKIKIKKIFKKYLKNIKNLVWN